jgi:hypothetical protein
MALLVERLRPRLAALGVGLDAALVGAVDVDAVLSTVPGADERAPLAQVWLDGRSSSDAVVILVPRAADRVLARKIASGAIFDEVALAEVVFVIERATASLLAARPVGVPKAEAEPELRRATAPPPATAPELPPPASGAPPPAASPLASPTPNAAPPSASPAPTAAAPSAAPEVTALPAPAPPQPAPPAATAAPPPPANGGGAGPDDAPEVVAATPARPSAWSYQLGAFLAAESWATGNVVVPAGGLETLFERVRGASRLGVALEGELRGTVDAATGYGNVALSGLGAHALFSYGRSFSRGVGRVAIGPGLAASDVRVTPRAGMAPVPATDQARSDIDATLAVEVRGDLALTRSVDAFVIAGADVAFVSGRYTAVVGSASTPLLTTWPVRPMLRLGLAIGR